MTTGLDFVKDALSIRGENSSIMPADSTFIIKGFGRLQQMLSMWEGRGIIIPLTFPTVPGDDLLEPIDTTGPIIDVLATYLTGVQTAITSDQRIQAVESYRSLGNAYMNEGVIPNQLFLNTTPIGAGNYHGPYENEFYPDPDAVLDNNQGVVNAPLENC